MNRTEKVELHVDYSKILFSVITQEWRTYLLQWRYGLLLCLHASSTLRLACVLWFYNFAVIYPPLPVFTISWLHVGICRETLNSRKIYFTAMVRKTGCCRSQWDMTCWWIKCTAVYISSSDSLCPQKLLRLL